MLEAYGEHAGQRCERPASCPYLLLVDRAQFEELLERLGTPPTPSSTPPPSSPPPKKRTSITEL